MKLFICFVFFTVNLWGYSNMAYSKEGAVCYKAGYNKKEGVFSLKDKYGKEQRCVYEESDQENALLKVSKKVNFDILINVSEGDVYSDIKIKNFDVRKIYIWRGDLYSFGNQLSGDFFNIITDAIRLQYLGVKVNFGAAPEDVSDYIVVAPGEEVNERIKLNSYYQFLPGEHQYDIGTVYIACGYTPRINGDYLSTNMDFWIRSNRKTIVINGSEVNDELAQFYTVK